MRSKLVLAVAAATAVTAGAVAQAASTTSYTLSTSSTATHAGTKAKPAAFVPTWTFDAKGPNGARPGRGVAWTWSWKGVHANGAQFPTCTADQIDKGQTDSICPKGSLVAQSPAGGFTAQLGPSADPMSSFTCEGKAIRIYNAGASGEVWYVTGPGDKCAGLAYVAPFKVPETRSGDTTSFKLTFPDNISQPLPGIEGALNHLQFKSTNQTTTVKGKTVHYLEATSCPGSKRTMTWIAQDPSGSTTVSASAGACKK